MTLTEEQMAIKRMVADFARRELAPTAFKPETEDEYRARLNKLAAQGLLGMTAPTDYGGGGLSYFDALLAVEEMARYDPRSASEMHTNGTGTASHLWVLGTPAQQERWLRPICQGRMRCAIAMTEPEAGSAATEMTTTATPTQDGAAYCLNGGKIFISGGKHADVFVTYARFLADGRPADGNRADQGGRNIGAIIVEKDTPGCSILRNDHNMADEDQAQLLFDDCRVPRENVLVTGNAFGRLIRIYNRNRLSGVAQALGMATASYEDALRHSQVRRQFGRELADFQGLQWMLADMAIQLNACRATLYQAAAAEVDGELDPVQVSMAKVFIAETCAHVCDMAIQLFGGYGYMADAPVNQRYRRVRGTAIYGGTMQIHRNMIAARILGRRNDQRRS
ncbi:MAG: acyl-CoA dehydrogenase family protein [Chloroflexi bacterium]|nr:acyl-CoA dehydrogenase family protein [Chloroflexota bacterium]